MAASIEGYASASSVAAGDAIDFSVRVSDVRFADFSMQVVRRGVADDVRDTRAGTARVWGPQDDARLAAEGCNWASVPSCRIVIPADWQSGYYVAKLTATNGSAEIPFFVRATTPGSTSRILLKMSDATAQAYTGWGGRSFYTTPHAPHVSYDRPYDDMALFERYQLPFVRWAESHGIVLEFASSLDLHQNSRLLDAYRLLISIGHDEYWSLEMRDQVEAFVASGGNVAFLSANTCYWQVRFDFERDHRIMTCYKETENKPPDPERGDLTRVTVRWFEPPLDRPENRMTGVSYRNGAGWWIDPIVPAARFRGYVVTNAEHWVYRDAGLANGDIFGAGTSVDDAILGYETDAALVQVGSDSPVVTGTDGTPADFVVLATADLRDWAAHGQGGGATLGTYRRNGIVFTAGTVNWGGGLHVDSEPTAVDVITQNLMRTLSSERPSSVTILTASFETWENGIPAGWTFDGAGTIAREAYAADVMANQFRFMPPATLGIRVDAARGETWIGRPSFMLAGSTTYGVGAWVRAATRGATIRLQTTDTWTDFTSAEHSGNDRWEYLFAHGSIARSDPAIPARVKLQVAGGARATYAQVVVVEL